MAPLEQGTTRLADMHLSITIRKDDKIDYCRDEYFYRIHTQ